MSPRFERRGGARPVVTIRALSAALVCIGLAGAAGCGGAAPQPEAVAPPVAPEHVDAGDPVQALLDQRVAALLATQPAAGMVIGTVRGSNARVYGYGRVGPHTGAVPDGDTVYALGSLTQVFTAVLLADAIVREAVALYDTVGQYLPRGPKVPYHADGPIRFEHLGAHTSGLPAVDAPWARRSLLGSLGRLARFLRGYSLSRAPGSVYEESAMGMTLLGMALAEQAGKDYESLLMERVILPLGMSSTRLSPSGSMAERLARGHAADGKAVGPARDAPTLGPCCALHSTVNDLLRLVVGYLRPDGRLTAAMDLTLAPRARHPEREARAGLGWLLDEGAAVVYQRGRRPGFDGFVAFHRERAAGVVVLASSEGWDLEALGREVLGVMLESDAAVAGR